MADANIPQDEEVRQIPLTNSDQVALVSACDYDRLMKYKWYLSERGYALCTRKGYTSGSGMHRMIVDPPKGFMPDHINGIRLDNRRSNLRKVNALQNAQNRKKNQNSRSMYKGVSWKVANAKWQARIRVVGLQYHIGLYDTELEAAYAYNQAAKLQHGDYSRLNKLPEDYIPPAPHGDCPLCHQSLTKREMGEDTEARVIEKIQQAIKDSPFSAANQKTAELVLDEVKTYFANLKTLTA